VGMGWETERLREGWVCLPQAYDDGGFSGATQTPVFRGIIYLAAVAA